MNTAELLFVAGGATESTFRKIELFEFEEEEENNAPIDIDDDDNYDNTDLFCEEDEEKDYDWRSVMRIFLPTLSNNAGI